MQGIGVKLGNIEQVKKQFDSLLKELQNKADKKPIQIGIADFSKLEKQLRDVEDKVKKSSENINKLTKGAFQGASKGDTYQYFQSAMEKVSSDIKKSGGQISDILTRVDEKTKAITSATIKYTDAMGKAKTEVYQLEQKWKTVGDKQVLDKVDLKLSSSTYDNNIAKQQTDNYNKLSGILKNIGDLKVKIAKLDAEQKNGVYGKELSTQLSRAELEYKKILNTQIKINEEEKTNAINKQQSIKLDEQQLNINNKIKEINAKQIDSTQKKTSTTTSGQMNLGELVTEGINFNASKSELTEYAKLVAGANAEWTKMTPKLVNGNQKIKEVSVRVADGKDKWQNYNMILDETEGKLYKVDRGLSDMNHMQMSFSEQMKIAVQRIIQWGASTLLVYGSLRKLKEGVQFVIEMDTALTDMGKVVDLTKDQMNEMRDSAIDMGKSLGKSATEIAQGFAEWGRVTKDLNEIKELTRVSTLASNVTDLSVADASKALSTSMINFKIQTKDAITVLDQLNEIQNNYKASAGNIAEGLAEVGGAAQQSGVEINKMEGYLTSLISSQGIEGSEAGTAMKSFISRTFRLGSEGEEDAGKTENVLNQIGVAVRDNTGTFREFDDILDDVSSKWSTLNKNQQINVAQTIGGTHHYSKFISLMENYKMATEASAVALDSQGSAMIENQKYMDSIQGRMAVLKVESQEMFKNMINSDFIKGTVSAITTLINTFGNLPSMIMIATTALIAFKGKAIFGFVTDLMAVVAGEKAATVATIGLSGAFKSLKVAFMSNPIGIIAVAVTSLISLFMILKNKADEAKKSQEQLMASLQDTSNEIQSKDKLVSKYEELSKKEYQNADSKKQLLDIQRQLANSYPELIDNVDEEGNKLVTNIKLVKEQIEADKELLKQKLLLASGTANQELPGLENDAARTKNRIDEISERLKSGNTKETRSYRDESGDMVEYEADTSSQLRSELAKLITHYEELTPKIRQYKGVVDEQNKITKETIKNEVIENIVKAKSSEQAQEYIDKLKSQGITQELINDVIKENTQELEKNAKAQQDGFDSNKGYNDAVKTFSDSLIKAKEDLKDINTVLEQHAESGEWNLETIIKLSDTYPQLLGLLGNEKELEQELTKIKGERVNIAKDALTKQIKNEENYLNEIFKGFGAEVSAYQSAQEAKLAISNQFAQRLTTLNEMIIKSEAARQAAIADGDQEAYELALKKKAMLVSLQLGLQGQIASINTHLDNYYKLKTISLNAGSFSNTGSKSYDGKTTSDAEKQAEQLRDKMESNVKDVEGAITEIIKKEFEKRKEIIEKEYDERKKSLQKQKDLYNQQNEDDDYNKDLKKEQDKLAEIQSKISSSRDTNTLAGKARLEDLVEQAKEQQEKIDDMILEHTRDRNNDLFDLELDKLDQQKQTDLDKLDEQYSDENISKMVNEAIITGKLKDINGEFINVIDAYKNFQNTFNDGLTASGQILQKEFIDKWAEVQKLIAGTSGVSVDINFSQLQVPKYDVGSTYIGNDQLAMVHQGEAILPAKFNIFTASGFNNFISKFKIPNINPRTNNPTINFNQPLVAVSGGISSEIDLNSVINQATDNVTRKIMQAFNDDAVYAH